MVKGVPRALPHSFWRVPYRYGGVRSAWGLRPSSSASVAASLSLPPLVPDSVSDLPATSVCVLLPNQQIPEHNSRALRCRARAPPCLRGLGQVHAQPTVGSARRHLWKARDGTQGSWAWSRWASPSRARVGGRSRRPRRRGLLTSRRQPTHALRRGRRDRTPTRSEEHTSELQ